jgi:succinate dehydrogenase/fumarate reductase cytochrome b subunit
MSGLPIPHRTSRRVQLRQVHRISAVIVGLFALVHIGNHLLALFGPELHIHGMEVLRLGYRQPLVEGILLLAVLVQIVTGGLQLWAGRGQRFSRFMRLQRWAGLVLALFLLQHLSAIIYGRFVQHVDTDFFFAAAVLVRFPRVLYFAPYYLLGVTALFVHLAIAARPLVARRFGRPAADRSAWVLIGLGGAIGLAILVAFTGLLYPIQLPPGY